MSYGLPLPPSYGLGWPESVTVGADPPFQAPRPEGSGFLDLRSDDKSAFSSLEAPSVVALVALLAMGGYLLIGHHGK